MVASSAVIAFVAATDLDRAREFYQGVLGLALTEQNGFAAVFDAHGTMLRVTAVEQVAPAGYTVLGWRVDDIDATVDALTEAGVAFARYEGMLQAANGVWATPGGDKVAWFRDPDGNTLSLTEFS
jgi:catechol 2,3-dioxygenase-like lactoylglutathione lyase family enzyme